MILAEVDYLCGTVAMPQGLFLLVLLSVSGEGHT
jgi:hypothetical protein